MYQLGEEWIRVLSKLFKKLKHLTQRAFSLKSKIGLALTLASNMLILQFSNSKASIVSGFPTNIIFILKPIYPSRKDLFDREVVHGKLRYVTAYSIPFVLLLCLRNSYFYVLNNSFNCQLKRFTVILKAFSKTNKNN